MVKTKNTPALRFKEFSEEWEVFKLKNMFSLVTRPVKMKDHIDYSLVTVKRRNGGVIHRGDYKGEEVKVKSQFVLEANDFLISKRQISHGACGLVPKHLAGSIVSNEYTVLNPKAHLDIVYFNYLCLLPRVNQKFFLSSTGVHIEKMIFKVDDWFKWQFSFPALPEQQKIAAFLSALDQKLIQLKRKKALLEQYKKGVMQKLFSQQLRFKSARSSGGDDNGNDYPDWEEKRLGEVTHVVMGQSPKSSSYNDKSIGVLLIQGNADIEGRVTSPRQWTSEPTKFCEVGQLILTVRAPVGAISKSIHYACIGRGVCAISSRESSQTEFIFQFFLHYESRWGSIEQGSTFTAISGADIKSLKINLPSVSEQQKIANYLSAIDSQIEAVARQISQTQTFKKGLLQQMFV